MLILVISLTIFIWTSFTWTVRFGWHAQLLYLYLSVLYQVENMCPKLQTACTVEGSFTEGRILWIESNRHSFCNPHLWVTLLYVTSAMHREYTVFPSAHREHSVLLGTMLTRCLLTKISDTEPRCYGVMWDIIMKYCSFILWQLHFYLLMFVSLLASIQFDLLITSFVIALPS